MDNINERISFCIPTYNGSNRLTNTLDLLVPIIKKYNINICISDNASTDNTQYVIEKYKKIYPYITYKCNKKNMGFSYNFCSALKMAKTDYVWILGDDDYVLKDGVETIMKIISVNDYDFIVVNGPVGKGLETVKTTVFNSSDELMINIGNHINWISTLILSKKYQCNNFCNEVLKYQDNAFPHVIAIYKLLKKKCMVKWVGKELVQDSNFGNRWMNNYLKFYIIDWYKMGEILRPNYSELAISSFLDRTSISGRVLVNLRCNNVLNFREYNRVKKYFKYYSRGKKWQYISIVLLCIPRDIIRSFCRMYEYIIQHRI